MCDKTAYMAIHAVLTADIVNSTRLSQATEKKLLKCLQELLAPHRFEFYRGDSFQVFMINATAALQTALLCRTAAIGISGSTAVASDIRISIGIGKVRNPVKALGTAKGEAFVLSGRAFDDLTNAGTRLVMAASNSMANEGLQVISNYLNAIFKDMTGKQASVIFELLKGESQQTVAAKFKKSKSTIHQHVTAGRWPEIENLLQHYQNMINLLL